MTSEMDKKILEIAEILKEELETLNVDLTDDKDLTNYLCALEDCAQLLASFIASQVVELKDISYKDIVRVGRAKEEQEFEVPEGTVFN